MSVLPVANAPCSWGVMRGFESEAPFPDCGQVLDEIAETGYEGTELGDSGFMPTDPDVLKPELDRRGLRLVGALVQLSLADPATHESGLVVALRTARLLAACGELRWMTGHSSSWQTTTAPMTSERNMRAELNRIME